MLKNIIFNQDKTIKQRIMLLRKYYIRRLTNNESWRKRYAKTFRLHPEYRRRCPQNHERDHQDYWRCLRSNVNLDTLRMCGNISGKSPREIVPEEVFASDIEPTLNLRPEVQFLSNKSFYNKWFGHGMFPDDYFHRIDGHYLNEYLDPIKQSEAFDLIDNKVDYPAVLKPNTDSAGGKGVVFVNNAREMRNIAGARDHYVVQREVKQSAILAKFNPNSINTVRVCLYRSVSDNKLHILNMSLRMGMGASGRVDNLTSGGILSHVKPDGYLHGYALDLYGKRFDRHPTTGLTFEELIPDIENLRRNSLTVARQIPYHHLTSLDMYHDEHGEWKPIEVNLAAHSIYFSQNAGSPFFGQFTDEVLSYCQAHHWSLK